MAEPNSVIDEDAIRLAASGDRDSMQEIYQEYGLRVYRTIRRIVGSADADDVMQDAFIQLFQKLPSFRFESAFTTWMHRLVVNEALQHLRKKGRKLVLVDQQHSTEIAVVDQSQSAVEVEEVMIRALSRLEPELRRILELKVIDELNYTQISEIVGIPEGTVGSRLNRARRELRDQLHSLGWEK